MAQTSLNSTGVASSGALSLQSNGTTEAIGISTGQVATLAQNPILTSGTANGVAYLNGSKVVTSGSALTFDGTTLGATKIATNSATSTGLSSGEIGLTNSAAIRWRNNANSAYINAIYVDSTDSLQLGGGGAVANQIFGIAGVGESMRLTSTGLGIGTSSPSYKLQVNSTGNIAYFRDTTNNTGLYMTGTASDARVVSDGKLSLQGTNGGGVAIVTASTERVFVDSSGNLGLGVTPSAWTTSSSTKALELTNGVSLSSYNSAAGLYQNAYVAAATGYTYKSTAAASAYQQAGGVHYWLNAASGTAGNAITFTQAMTLDASGNLLVGKTAVGTYNANSFGFEVSTGTLATGHLNGSSSGSVYNYFLYNGSVIGSITQNGTTGVLYNLTSDYRLKNNPVALTGSGAFIDALQPKTWDWWDGSGKGVGFIAHEFMEVAKYSGNGEKDAVDENGNPVYQSIQPSSSEVMANLVAEIKSLRQRLAAAGIA